MQLRQFPYNEMYGLDDETRLKAVELANEIGVRKASKQMNVSIASVYKWRKAIKENINA
jgi:transposase-like protein